MRGCHTRWFKVQGVMMPMISSQRGGNFMFRRYTAIGALLLCCTTGLLAQGLNTRATKNDWEEINFEFNSSILSDGYPSLLRLADLMTQHRDYRVKVTGHTDYVGSAPYNDKLALRRAEAVKAFLVKYG